jgi:hypothetical protein
MQFIKFILDVDYRLYNLNYTPIALGVQSWREITSGGTRTKKVQYHWSRIYWFETYVEEYNL